MRIILLGASGLTGSKVLQRALKEDSINEVICYLRHSLNSGSDKVSEIIISTNEMLELSSLPKVDAIICCLGTTIKKAGSKEVFRKVDVELPLKFASLAKNVATSCFVLQSSLGAQKPGNNFYLSCKAEIEDKITALNFNSFTIIRPSLLTGNRSEVRFGEIVGEFFLKLLSPFMIGSLRKYKAVKADDVAYAMLNAALNQNAGNTIIESGEIGF
ncbi:MAG: oxidoreductase [Bacteroidia bacterium]